MADSDPTLNANDIVEVSWRGELCGQTCLNITHYRLKTVVTPNLTEAMDALHGKLTGVGSLQENIVAAAAPNYTLKEVVLQMIYPVRFARFPYTLDLPGLQTDDALTADLAAFIEFSTPFITQRKLKLKHGQNGGVHFAPVPAEFEEEGLLTAGYRDGALQDLGAKFTAELIIAGGNTWTPVLYHPNDTAPRYTDITRFNVKQEVRVMRRRTVGRGI